MVTDDEARRARDLVWTVLTNVRGDKTAARDFATILSGRVLPVSAATLATATATITAELTGRAVRSGWGPTDLGEVVRRRLTQRHLPLLSTQLRDEAERHPAEAVTDQWRSDLDALGPAEPARPHTPDGLELLIGLASLLRMLPPIPALLTPPGAARGTQRRAVSDDRQLARVRALLAKAESTTFPEEAEALSAKAQELISRHALERVLADARADAPDVTSRRFWIDPPYVMPKAMLIDAVARANHCRSVVSEPLGFSSLVGHEADLDAVELLVTSLMVQADVALLRAGQHHPTGGRQRGSRSTSFRRSFLVSYATRIGERLATSADEAQRATGDSAALVPLLRRRAEQVAATVTELFPDLVEQRVGVGNLAGWAAGRAAADTAALDPRRRLAAEAG